jgi:hypothetical protein
MALEALVARGATPGEREAARQALAKALEAERAAAPPKTGGPPRGRIHGVDFTIRIDNKDARAGFHWFDDIFRDITITFENSDSVFAAQQKARRESERAFMDELLRKARAQQPKPPPPGPFGDGSPGPGPKKCEPKPKGEAKFGAPRSCGYAFNASLVLPSESPIGGACYLVRGLLMHEVMRFKVSGEPVILTEHHEFGARCVHWSQQEPDGPVLAYFERLTDNGRYEAAGTIGEDFLVDCDERRAIRLMRQPGIRVNDPMLYLVTHEGKTWVCRCLGPCEGGARFSKVATRPAILTSDRKDIRPWTPPTSSTRSTP